MASAWPFVAAQRSTDSRFQPIGGGRGRSWRCHSRFSEIFKKSRFQASDGIRNRPIIQDIRPLAISAMLSVGAATSPSNDPSNHSKVHPSKSHSTFHDAITPINPSHQFSKRNSSMAGFPSPSKAASAEQENNSDSPKLVSFQSNPNSSKSDKIRPLRQSKRRKERRQLQQINSNQPSSDTLIQNSAISPLLSKKNAALDALLNRIALRHQHQSCQSKTNPKSNIESDDDKKLKAKQRASLSNPQIKPIIELDDKKLKGKQKLDQIQPINDVSNQCIPSSNLNQIKTKPKLPPQLHSNIQEPTKTNSSNLHLTTLMPVPQFASHLSRQTSMHSTKLHNKIMPTAARPTSSNSISKSNNHCPSQSKLANDNLPKPVPQPTCYPSKPDQSSISQKSITPKEVVREPWDTDLDEDFDDQLLELVDLVDNETVTKKAPDSKPSYQHSKNSLGQETNGSSAIASTILRPSTSRVLNLPRNEKNIPASKTAGQSAHLKSNVQYSKNLINCNKSSASNCQPENSLNYKAALLSKEPNKFNGPVKPAGDSFQNRPNSGAVGPSSSMGSTTYYKSSLQNYGGAQRPTSFRVPISSNSILNQAYTSKTLQCSQSNLKINKIITSNQLTCKSVINNLSSLQQPTIRSKSLLTATIAGKERIFSRVDSNCSTEEVEFLLDGLGGDDLDWDPNE
ncbi:hypothetical protein O181_022649 [Austropuccinia psidii MF-1]|uniref:Uncharacterized protein n=1 Tax=Austropuccinia psidii MF-1 TaxID=1389203 RepID=A0A9Q3GXW7_9BASI|nr:hypothetical protein [Austropuccinia psidii MF-1]